MCSCDKANESGKQKPNASCDGSVSGCTPQKITSIDINYVKFLSDHGLMKDNTTDYLDTGALYPKIQWKPGARFPISHSTTGSIEVEIEMEVKPAGATPESGNLVCEVDGHEWFRQNGINFSPGTQKVKLKSGPFPNKYIQWKDHAFNWKTEGVSVSTTPSTTNHEIAFTLGKPEGYEDSGITQKRMSKSATLLGSYGETDSHKIVKKLMTTLGKYVLRTNPAVPSEYHHPDYYNSKGGAWPLMDYLAYYAECQAIVRFVGDVIKQVGAPGTIEMIYVFAKPPNPKVAQEDTTGVTLTGTNYSLVDSPVTVGQVYPPSHTILPDGSTSVGFNNYEACLKFTDGGVMKYYGGGTGGAAFDNKQQVIKAFTALVEVEFGWYPNSADPHKVEGFKVKSILAKNSDW